MHFILFNSLIHNEGGTISVTILQMRNLKLREIKEHGHSHMRDEAGISPQICQIHNSALSTNDFYLILYLTIILCSSIILWTCIKI